MTFLNAAKSQLIVIFIVTTLYSCRTEEPYIEPDIREPAEESFVKPTVSSYILQIEGMTEDSFTINRSFIADTVDATWKKDLGLVWMSTGTQPPYATLTLSLGPLVPNSGAYGIASATLSTTDTLVGTAQQLNARLYTHKSGGVIVPTVIQMAVL
jgi:hypothetical protein